MYWPEISHVSINGNITEEVTIPRGVRPGCILTSLLFNIFSEIILQESITSLDQGVKVNDIFINNIHYADDTALIADNFIGLQEPFYKVTIRSKEFGLRINKKKNNKYMLIGRKNKEVKNKKF